MEEYRFYCACQFQKSLAKYFPECYIIFRKPVEFKQGLSYDEKL